MAKRAKTATLQDKRQGNFFIFLFSHFFIFSFGEGVHGEGGAADTGNLEGVRDHREDDKGEEHRDHRG